MEGRSKEGYADERVGVEYVHAEACADAVCRMSGRTSVVFAVR